MTSLEAPRQDLLLPRAPRQVKDQGHVQAPRRGRAGFSSSPPWRTVALEHAERRGSAGDATKEPGWNGWLVRGPDKKHAAGNGEQAVLVRGAGERCVRASGDEDKR